jgi:hypothetical protein
LSLWLVRQALSCFRGVAFVGTICRIGNRDGIECSRSGIENLDCGGSTSGAHQLACSSGLARKLAPLKSCQELEGRKTELRNSGNGDDEVARSTSLVAKEERQDTHLKTIIQLCLVLLALSCTRCSNNSARTKTPSYSRICMSC